MSAHFQQETSNLQTFFLSNQILFRLLSKIFHIAHVEVVSQDFVLLRVQIEKSEQENFTIIQIKKFTAEISSAEFLTAVNLFKS